MSYTNESPKLNDLVGRKIITIERSADTLTMYLDNLQKVRFYHSQSCCESVDLIDTNIPVSDLVEEIIQTIELATNGDDPPITTEYGYTPKSYTWTFLKIRTNKCSFTARWYGTSNGYYGESVNFIITSVLNPAKED